MKNTIKIPSICKMAGLIGLALTLTGCQLWEMASYQWHNADATPGWLPAEQGEEQSRQGVPFTMYNNHIVVQASVNGSEPMNFVLDSGAMATVILETDATDKLRLSKKNEMTISGAGDDGDPVAYIVHDQRVQTGNIFIDNLSLIYAPTDAMPFDTRDEAYFDGVLGADFFNCCFVEINHDLKRVYFLPRNKDAAERYSEGNWQRIGINLSGDTPYLTTTVNDGVKDTSVQVMLDTGSTGTLTLFAGDGRVSVPSDTYEARTTGVSGDSSNLVGYLKTLDIGEHSFEQMPVYFRVSGSNPQHGSDGVLGNRVLSQFNQVFDFKGEVLYIEKRTTVDMTLEADRSGLRLLPHKKGAIVKDIAADAEANTLGLKVNDIVTHIQGMPVDKNSFDQLVAGLSSETLNKVTLCWQADTGKTCGALPLADRIKP